MVVDSLTLTKKNHTIIKVLQIKNKLKETPGLSPNVLIISKLPVDGSEEPHKCEAPIMNKNGGKNS